MYEGSQVPWSYSRPPPSPSCLPPLHWHSSWMGARMDDRLHCMTFGRHLWGVPSPPRGTLEVSAELRVSRPSLGLGEVLDPLALLISTKHKGVCPATHRHPAWVLASLGTCLAAHAASNGTQASVTYGLISSIASPRHVCVKL